MTKQVLGERDCQAAVFIYKDDGTEGQALKDAIGITQRQGKMRIESHADKQNTLSGLESWNNEVNPDNAFLCIYAHMGPLGINCISGNSSTRITWQELSSVLPNGVAVLWLVGCKSEECLNQWQPLSSPVRQILLATNKSIPWGVFLKCFESEISISQIRSYDEMPSHIATIAPDVSPYIEYFRLSGSTFVKVP